MRTLPAKWAGRGPKLMNGVFASIQNRHGMPRRAVREDRRIVGLGWHFKRTLRGLQGNRSKENLPSSSPCEGLFSPRAAGIQHKKAPKARFLCPSDDSCAGSPTVDAPESAHSVEDDGRWGFQAIALATCVCCVEADFILGAFEYIVTIAVVYAGR